MKHLFNDLKSKETIYSVVRPVQPDQFQDPLIQFLKMNDCKILLPEASYTLFRQELKNILKKVDSNYATVSSD